LADGPAGFPPDCTCPAVLRNPLGVARLRRQGCHLLWPTVPGPFVSTSDCHSAGPTTPGVLRPPVWPGPRSLAATRGISVLISAPAGTEMFHFPAFASRGLWIRPRDTPRSRAGGLPHSGIFGSRPVSGSPKLIAAVHALHRLSSPRHPPYALRSLTVVRRRGHDPPHTHTYVPLEIRIRCAVTYFSCQRARGSAEPSARSLKTGSRDRTADGAGGVGAAGCVSVERR
jgi:hypothetical protein